MTLSLTVMKKNIVKTRNRVGTDRLGQFVMKGDKVGTGRPGQSRLNKRPARYTQTGASK